MAMHRFGVLAAEGRACEPFRRRFGFTGTRTSSTAPTQAASAISDYHALLDRMRTEYAKEMANPPGGIRYPMEAPFLSKDFVTSATQAFEHAATLASGDDELMRRVERAKLPILYVQCVRGPEFTGDTYAQVVADFERIARREKVKYLQEGGEDFEPKLASYKSKIAKPAGSQP